MDNHFYSWFIIYVDNKVNYVQTKHPHVFLLGPCIMSSWLTSFLHLVLIIWSIIWRADAGLLLTVNVLGSPLQDTLFPLKRVFPKIRAYSDDRCVLRSTLKNIVVNINWSHFQRWRAVHCKSLNLILSTLALSLSIALLLRLSYKSNIWDLLHGNVRS